jgi:hypothetical protein
MNKLHYKYILEFEAQISTDVNIYEDIDNILEIMTHAFRESSTLETLAGILMDAGIENVIQDMLSVHVLVDSGALIILISIYSETPLKLSFEKRIVKTMLETVNEITNLAILENEFGDNLKPENGEDEFVAEDWALQMK